MSQNSGFVLYGAESGVATITKNRPEKLNALVGSMREDILGAFSQDALEGMRAFLEKRPPKFSGR